MEPMSPVLECPPTDIFQLRVTKYSEERSSRSSLQQYNLEPAPSSQNHTRCEHSESEVSWLKVTPAPHTLSKSRFFNEVSVCWECDSDCVEQQSPLKRKCPRRFSSLGSATMPMDKPLEPIRQISDHLAPLVAIEAKIVHRVPTRLKQENIPYSFSLPIRTLAQLDGTSDNVDGKAPDMCPSEHSSWSDATADTPSKDSPASEEDEMSSGTPSTSPSTTRHRVKIWDDSVDLTLPDHSALPDPFELFQDTPTPLTRASPATGSFPFPLDRRSINSLSPLSSRSSASPLRPSQRRPVLDSRSSSYTPSRRPDRFIPARKTSQSMRESLQITKSANKLIGSAKVLRTNVGASDPFSRIIPQTPPRITNRPRPPTALTRTGSNGPHNVLGVRRASLAFPNRQVSNGAVWNVGGAAALGDSVAGVPHGRSGLLASGTNARLYSSKFLACTDTAIELEVHERRLALAMDLNPASRILTYQPWDSSSPISPTSSISLSPGAMGNRVWRDNEWVEEGSVICLL
jgi:hypothetical protein